MNVRPHPCPACPFSRASTPGALGGSPALTFIGQVYGPFALPCHKACDFNDPEWRLKAAVVRQCAGAASFRTHIGVAYLLPKALPILPANPEVFSTPEEFLAHHERLSLTDASLQLRITPPDVLLRRELLDRNVITRIEPS